MNFLIFLVFGALVGWLASLLLKTNSQQGLIGDIILGILGSMVGGYVMNAFNQPGVTGFNLYSILVGVVGAIVLVAVGRLLLSIIR